MPCVASSLINGFRTHETTGSCGDEGKPRIPFPRSLGPNVGSATMAREPPCGSGFSGDRKHDSPTPSRPVREAQRAWLSAGQSPTSDRLARRQASRISVARTGSGGSRVCQALDGLLQVVTHHDRVQIRFSRFGCSARYGCFCISSSFSDVFQEAHSIQPGFDWDGAHAPIGGYIDRNRHRMRIGGMKYFEALAGSIQETGFWLRCSDGRRGTGSGNWCPMSQ